MSPRVALSAVLLLAGTGITVAQEPPPPAAPTAPTQTTVVHGRPPDLNGRWLVLFDIAEKAVRRTVASFVEIRTVDGKPEVLEHFVDLPEDMKAALEEHNQTASIWEPTAGDLTALAERWDSLPAADRGVSQVTNDLWEAAAFSDAEREDPVIAESIWVLRQTMGFAPGGQRPATQVNVYGASARDGTGWRGSGVLAQVLAAPFPVPITLKGTFRMRRVEAVPGATGFLARLFDAFKGCR